MLSLGLIALVFLLLILGQPLYILIGSVTAYCYYFFGGGELQVIIEDIFYAGNREIILAIPLFILAGNIMTHGSISNRLIELARTLTAAIPSGLAISAVLSCAVFAAISGSSPVTLIAVGSIMYPALLKAGYDKDLSMGILTAGGTLGIIIPPSIPMIIFAIMAQVSVTEMFIAGIGPGILLVSILIIYALVRGSGTRGTFSLAESITASKRGVLALLMPLVILGGIYSGFFTATESAGVALVYALVVELFIHREISFKQLPKIFTQSAEMLGTLFLILILAVSLNKFMTYEEIPQNLVAIMRDFVTSPIGFLIMVNIMLLVVGCVMDIMSAILVMAPLLTPIAIHYGIDPVHFGIIMIVNLEIGYLTPPVGINLFVASGIFKESIGRMIRAVIPLVLVLLIGLILITFVPEISLIFLDR